MAEFQEVMKHTKRMCDSMESCNRCPMPRDDAEFTCPMCDCVGDAKEYERIVMDWAEKHPESRYPTWTEWLRMLGVERLSDIIPADVAEKLGIKPIEVKNDA